MRTLAPVTLLVALSLSACGGGGDPVDRFVGPYRSLGLTGYASMPQFAYFSHWWGSVDSDGHGGLQRRFTMLEMGEASEEFAGSYALHADDTLDLTVGAWTPRGGLERLGRAAVFLDEHAFGPHFFVLLARIGAFDEGTLSGPYHWAALADDARAFALSGSRGTFDGAGHWETTPITVTHGGFVGEATPAADLTYAITADGELTIRGAAGERDLVGGVLPGGDVAVAIGGTDPEQDGAFYAFVRAGSGLSADSLRPSYWLTGFRAHVPAGSFYEEYSAFFATLVADGAGRCYFEGREDRLSGVVAADAFSADYTVLDDGALTLAIDDGGATLVGGVSPDGSFLTLGGGTAEGDDTWFVFGIAR